MPPQPADVATLTAIGLKRRLDSGERLAVLDVREDDERELCAIAVPGDAVDLHVPMGQVPARFDEIAAAASEGPLVVYCHLGMRSMVVARWLAARGVAGLHNLDGGIDAWSVDVDPSLPRY